MMQTLRSRLPLVASILLVAALAALLATRVQWPQDLFTDPAHATLWIENWGPMAPMAVITLQVVQVLLAPVPGQVVGVASGYLFGVAWGTLFSLLGTTLGSLIGVVLARKLGRPLVERLVPGETLVWLDAGARRWGPFFFVLVFLLPFLPDDLACLFAGLTPIPIPAMMLAVVVGRAPGIFVSCWLGANATNVPPQAWVALVAVSIALALLFLCGSKHVEQGVVSLLQRLSR